MDDTISPLAFIVHEVVSNSYKYAFDETIENPCISCVLKSKVSGDYTLDISDNGIGMDVNAVSSTSIGLDLIKSFTEDIEGKLSYGSDGNGVSYKIDFKEI